MLLKLTIQYLLSTGYQIVEKDLDKRITCIHTTNSYVITQLVNGYTVICKETEVNTLFKGIVHNVQELKGVLNLISRKK